VRVALVGQTPSATADQLEGHAGARIARLIGVSTDVLYAHQRFARVNLLTEFPGKAGEKGDLFDLRAARERAPAVLAKIGPDAVVVCLGLNVLKAFAAYLPRGACSRARFYDAVPGLDGRTYVLAPHPSGISHYWNEPENVSAAERFFRGLWRWTVHCVERLEPLERVQLDRFERGDDAYSGVELARMNAWLKHWLWPEAYDEYQHDRGTD